MRYREIELPSRGGMRSYVLHTLRTSGAEVYRLPLQPGETTPRIVEARGTWDVNIDPTTLTETTDPVPLGWTRA